MRCLVRGLFRTSVIGAAILAAVAGGAVLVAGPDSVHAVVDQVRDDIRDRIDSAVDDPVALRRQLAELERTYPGKIKEARGDLEELRGEIARLERERAVSDRVVALIDDDLAVLEPAVRTAREARTEGGAALAAVSFGDEVMSLGRAKARLRQVHRTRAAHVARAADAEHNLKYLRQQEGRFEGLVHELEGEHAQLQTQLVQLSQEVESIARNERLIEMLKKRQRVLDDLGRHDAVSLEQIRSRLARIRTEQEAELDLLASGRRASGYEEMATMQLDEERACERAEARVLLPAGD